MRTRTPTLTIILNCESKGSPLGRKPIVRTVDIGNDEEIEKKRYERILNFFYIQTVKLHKLVLQYYFRTMRYIGKFRCYIQ